MPKTILVIDDEEKLTIGLSAILHRAGYEVIVAHAGADGLAAAREHHPDLILCDVMMPPPNGIELRKILGREETLADIPFIFLTARTSQADKNFGLEAGADDYVTKPFDRQELLARVRATLRRQEIGRAQGKADTGPLRQEIARTFNHEFRTPLAVILQMLDLAMENRFAADPDQQRWFMEAALSSAHDLQWLIEDLMALYDVDQQNINVLRRSLDLRFALTAPIQLCQAHWKEKEIDIQVAIDGQALILAPQDGFRQAVRHLVDNACKFAPPHSVVRVRLVADGSGGCTLTVIDGGPGIPPPLREKVFDRYFQIDQGTERRSGGLGVGLSIARDFARALGGDVVILASAPGCHVQMTIPPVKGARHE